MRRRIRAGGLVPSDELDAYRMASLEVWSLVESAAERRRSGEIAPVENLGAWILFSLQTFGNALLDADVAADPATVGYVPPLLHGTVLNLYREIGPWLLRANEARADPGLVIRRKSPVSLPQTPRGILESPVGIHALLVTVRALRDELPHLTEGAATEPKVQAALAAARYAEALVPLGDSLDPNDLAHLGRPLRNAASQLFRAGQVAALPSLGGPRR